MHNSEAQHSTGRTLANFQRHFETLLSRVLLKPFKTVIINPVMRLTREECREAERMVRMKGYTALIGQLSPETGPVIETAILIFRDDEAQNVWLSSAEAAKRLRVLFTN